MRTINYKKKYRVITTWCDETMDPSNICTLPATLNEILV